MQDHLMALNVGQGEEAIVIAATVGALLMCWV
jgi:hypothetical protein